MNRFLYNCIRCFSHCNNCYRLLLIIRKATINPTSFLFKQQKRAGWPTLFTDFYNKSCLHHTTRTHLLQTLCFTWLVYCQRSEEHTSELQSRFDLVCRLLLEKKKKM